MSHEASIGVEEEMNIYGGIAMMQLLRNYLLAEFPKPQMQETDGRRCPAWGSEAGITGCNLSEKLWLIDV